MQYIFSFLYVRTYRTYINIKQQFEICNTSYRHTSRWQTSLLTLYDELNFPSCRATGTSYDTEISQSCLPIKQFAIFVGLLIICLSSANLQYAQLISLLSFQLRYSYCKLSQFAILFDLLPCLPGIPPGIQICDIFFFEFLRLVPRKSRLVTGP